MEKCGVHEGLKFLFELFQPLFEPFELAELSNAGEEWVSQLQLVEENRQKPAGVIVEENIAKPNQLLFLEV